jgi:hypothetical protein
LNQFSIHYQLVSSKKDSKYQLDQKENYSLSLTVRGRRNCLKKPESNPLTILPIFPEYVIEEAAIIKLIQIWFDYKY